MRWALLLFFVPALAVRYGVNFGTPLIAVAAALVVFLAAAGCALREALADLRRSRLALWAVQAAVALLVGGAAGYAAVRMMTDQYYEAGLLRGVSVCFAVIVAVCALTDHWLGGVTLRGGRALN
ncbi:hypothetical protein [Actinomadura sp. BRA 177]|uniref:hypothetical protein n=1 Tax=Actinomadura sp. BRA 177 TaxID=2745202 RepID=UPI00159502B8|nr:hypothetical protein [Actinomadura sp. BRA 177]NVI89418.1 hypothetical protein [Actinomadura sp. BRA 177]